MRKAISPIIAIILMLIITIALAGTAYVYISGLITARTAHAISTDFDCVDGKIMLIVYNEGTDIINNTATEKDLEIYVNGVRNTTDFFENGQAGDTIYGIEPQESLVLVSNTSYPPGKVSVLVKTSTNVNNLEVWC